MYAKLIDGVLYPAPNAVTTDAGVVYHPTPELLQSLGWMPVIDTPHPDMPGVEAMYYESRWTLSEGMIVRVWEETDPPEKLEPVPTLDERVTALETEYTETREALDMILSGVTE